MDGDQNEAMALTRWLLDVRELRGRTRRVAGQIDPESMGTVTDIVVPLAEAFAAGALTALGEALVTFVTQRRTRVTVHLQDRTGTVCRIEVAGGDNPAALAGELARIAAGEGRP